MEFGDDFMEIGNTHLVPIGEGKFRNTLDGTIIEFVEDDDYDEDPKED